MTILAKIVRKAVVFDTSLFPQIIGKLALLQDYPPFVLERVTRSCLAPVYS